MKFKNLTLLLLLTSTFSLLTSCDTTDPPSNKKITLEFEDASCTEAWLKLKAENISLPAEIKIIENDSTFLSANINSNDTTLFIENLLPNQTYNLHSTIHPFNQSCLKSNSVSVTTMDTTSHNFTWETFEFGGANGSSDLHDVAIINENNIWAVGEIHTAETDQFDSNGVWVQPYNAVHWDGIEWMLKRIMFYTFCNQEHKAPYPVKAVFSFTDGIVVATSGSQIVFIENGVQKQIECIPVSVNAIWGTSSKDFYIVGYGGKIAHYNGSSWTRIESGTELNIMNIYGYGNNSNYEQEIICIASNMYQDAGNEVLKLDGLEIKKLSTLNLPIYHSGIWFVPNRVYYIAGPAIYRKTNINNNENWNQYAVGSFYSYYTNSIDGQGFNDIVTGGSFGELIHFNGNTWKNYREEINKLNSNIKSITTYNNTIAACGYNGVKAMLIVGKR